MNEKKYSMVEVEKPKKEKKKKVPASKRPIYGDAEESKKNLANRINSLELDIDEYTETFRKDESAFQLFLFRCIMLSLNMFDALDAENRNEYWSEGTDVLLLSHYMDNWSDEEKKEAYSWRRRTPEADPNRKYPKLGALVNKPSGWARLVRKAGSSTAAESLEMSDVDLEALHERLTKIIFLQLENVILFKPLKDYTFPRNIQFLSIEQSNAESHSGYPESCWTDLFGGCKFPGVKYLRIRFAEESSWRKKGEEKKEMDAKTLQGNILQTLLNENTVPNLEYLVLNGCSRADVLQELKPYLKRLTSIEVTFDYESRSSESFAEFTSLTTSLSASSDKLKYVVIETNLDCRDGLSHRNIERFYTSHQCVASIGYASISRFYYISGE